MKSKFYIGLIGIAAVLSACGSNDDPIEDPDPMPGVIGLSETEIRLPNFYYECEVTTDADRWILDSIESRLMEAHYLFDGYPEMPDSALHTDVRSVAHFSIPAKDIGFSVTFDSLTVDYKDRTLTLKSKPMPKESNEEYAVRRNYLIHLSKGNVHEVLTARQANYVGWWDDQIGLSAKEIVFDAKGGTKTIRTTKGNGWWFLGVRFSAEYTDYEPFDDRRDLSDEFEGTSRWITVSRSTEPEFTVTVEPNKTGVDRQAQIDFGAGDYFDKLIITQTK